MMRPKRFQMWFLPAILLLAFEVACRGTLPPTQPQLGGESAPSTTTNDAPTAGPLAGDGSIFAAGSGSGGTSVLPIPPPGGSGGGTAGSGIR